MEKYPTLDLIVRFGRPAAVVLGALVFALVLWLLLPALGWIALAPAALAGGLVFVVVRSYAELVLLVTDMLLPR